MCGICGFVDNKTPHIDLEAFTKQISSLSHRGPDDEGIFHEPHIALGHRRLSIIDLKTGHQPIHNEDHSLWLVFNGEIYNYKELTALLKGKGHRFATQTDSEVIVHLYEEYKEDCVKHLNGIFAFGIWNKRDRSLFLARDHMGVKPLFYYHRGERLIFGSELKSIVANPLVERKLNTTALFHYFSNNYVPSPLTMFRDCHALPAGHFLLFKGKEPKVRRYWDIDFSKRLTKSENDIAEELRLRIADSVRMQLVSDVPVGSFLSGGIDSSTIVALMKEGMPGPLKTFNVGFREKSFNESDQAERVAGRLGTDHHTVLCEPSDYIKSVSDIIWHADNLTTDISMLPLYLVSRLAGEHLKVVLSGDGADELFAGYPTYAADKLLSYYRKLPRWLTAKAVPALVNTLPPSRQKMGFEFKAKRFIEGTHYDPDRAHSQWRHIFTDTEKEKLFAPEMDLNRKDDFFWPYQRFYESQDDRSLNRHLYADSKVWLVDSILSKVDSMSMAHSLEVRVPFLNPRIVEYAAKIPPDMKLKGFREKYILRKAVRDLLPADVLKRKKAGFMIPVGHWFRHELRGWIRETLSEKRVRSCGLLRPEAVSRWLDEHLTEKQNHGYKLLSLTHFILWYDTYISPSQIAIPIEGKS